MLRPLCPPLVPLLPIYCPHIGGGYINRPPIGALKQLIADNVSVVRTYYIINQGLASNIQCIRWGLYEPNCMSFGLVD